MAHSNDIIEDVLLNNYRIVESSGTETIYRPHAATKTEILYKGEVIRQAVSSWEDHIRFITFTNNKGATVTVPAQEDVESVPHMKLRAKHAPVPVFPLN